MSNSLEEDNEEYVEELDPQIMEFDPKNHQSSNSVISTNQLGLNVNIVLVKYETNKKYS